VAARRALEAWAEHLLEAQAGHPLEAQAGYPLEAQRERAETVERAARNRRAGGAATAMVG